MRGIFYDRDVMFGPNTKIVQASQSIQSVIDSVDDASASNPYTVIRPPGHESESYTVPAHITVAQPGNKTATFTIAASDSLNRHTADLICDGINDEIQIYQAMDAIYNNSPIGSTIGSPGGKGSILLLGGTYTIWEPVEMKPGISLIGASFTTGVYVRARNELNGNLFQFTENSVNPSAGFLFRNIFFDGVRVNQTTTSTAINTKMGAHALWDLWIEDCAFFDFKGTALVIEDPWGFRMWNSHIEDCDSHSMEINKGVSKTEGATLIGNKIIQCGDSLKLNDVDGTMIIGNELNTEGVGKYAVEVVTGAGGRGHGNIITANKFWFGTNGISISPGSISNRVVNNSFSQLSGTEINDLGTSTIIQANRGDGNSNADKTPNSMNVGGISEYADNAAALTAGLVAGDFYRTGDVSKIVH